MPLIAPEGVASLRTTNVHRLAQFLVASLLLALFGVAHNEITIATAATIVYANSATGSDTTGNGTAGSP